MSVQKCSLLFNKQQILETGNKTRTSLLDAGAALNVMLTLKRIFPDTSPTFPDVKPPYSFRFSRKVVTLLSQLKIAHL